MTRAADNVVSPAAHGTLLCSLASWWEGAANRRNRFSRVPSSLPAPCSSESQTLAADEDSTPWVVRPGHQEASGLSFQSPCSQGPHAASNTRVVGCGADPPQCLPPSLVHCNQFPDRVYLQPYR